MSLSRTASQQGGLLISLALLLFIISLLAAGSVGFLLWRDGVQSIDSLKGVAAGHLPEATPTPLPLDSSLVAPLVLPPELSSDRAELEKQLWNPLRTYYATSEEQLQEIKVEASADPKHTLHVTVTTEQKDEAITHTFFFDRTGADKTGPYPKWELAMFNNDK